MRRLLYTLALVLASTSMPGGVAYAAADLITSTPAAGATVEATLDTIRVVFSEPITAESTLTLVDAQGTVMSNNSRLANEDASAKTLVLATENLTSGDYTVSWFTVSANDLSLAEGSFTFTVRAPAAPTAVPATATRPASTATVAAASTAAPTNEAQPTPVAATRTSSPVPTERATARPTQRAAGGTTTDRAGGDQSGSDALAPTKQPTTREIPLTSALPNTAGGTPTAWSFGIFAGLAALVVWGVRRRMR